MPNVARPVIPIIASVVGVLALYAAARAAFDGSSPAKSLAGFFHLGSSSADRAGKQAIMRFGCGACHMIPGIANARGEVGPSLEGVARRAMIGGSVPNTPDTLAAWIRNPRAFAQNSAMPTLNFSPAEAADIVDYLYREAN